MSLEKLGDTIYCMNYYDDTIWNVCLARRQSQLPKYFKIYDREVDREYKAYVVNLNLRMRYESKRCHNYNKLTDFLYNETKIKDEMHLKAYTSFIKEKFQYKDEYVHKSIIKLNIGEQTYVFCIN